MNILTGTIIEIQSHEGLSLIKVQAQNAIVFTAIILDDINTIAYLQNGNTVDILFKETEVIITNDLDLSISIQNRVPGIVKSITAGVLLSQVNIGFGEKTISSIITSNACKQLALKENDKVLALIKTNEISLAPHD